MPKIVNFKIILPPSVFENAVASSNFNYHFTMPHLSPVENIRHPRYGVKDVEAPMLGNLWDYTSDSPWWVHTNDVITTLTKYSSSHFSTTIQNAEGNVLISMYQSVKFSGLLVGVNYYWVTHCIVQTRSRKLEGLRAFYRE